MQQQKDITHQTQNKFLQGSNILITLKVRLYNMLDHPQGCTDHQNIQIPSIYPRD